MYVRSLSSALLCLACGLPLLGVDTVPPLQPVVNPIESTFTLEFRGATLRQVLDYLSEKAGYIIANPVDLPAPITLVAKQPVSANEAIEVLNSVLLTQGFAAIIRGKTLHIVTLPTAREHNLPVFVGTDPSKIPDTDQMVTQVMPVQFATVKDLAENLSPLLNATSATLAANESSNVLILTDTQSHIKRIASILHAIDRAVSGVQSVRVYQLAHADAEKVAQIITTLYGKPPTSPRSPFSPDIKDKNKSSGEAREMAISAAADSGTNSLVIRASPETIEILSEVVAKLDVDNSARDGVLLYRVRNGKASDLAVSLNELFTGVQNGNNNKNNLRTAGQTRGTTSTSTPSNGFTQPSSFPSQGPSSSSSSSNAKTTAGTSDAALDLSGQVHVVADSTSNSVMVLSPERNFTRIRTLLEDLDQPMRQVLVRVLVAEVTIEKGVDIGVQLYGGPEKSPSQSHVFSNFNLFDPALGMNGFLIDNTDFRASVKALATNSNFDVLSRPYILTTDNREATVNVSQEVPVINGSRTDQNNNVTSTFDRRDVGIILTVTPQINSQGLVVLDVTQELSALSEVGITIAPGVESPIINKRTMTTRVVVEHGQTAVIGGLVTDRLSEKVNKVPLLGDIPLLGWFFRRTESTKAQTELLVFLTPQVVRSPDELSDLSRQLRGEMQRLDAAVQKGLLQQHLSQLANTKIGDPVTPAAPIPPILPTESTTTPGNKP
jgi:general secretion pathway protein D